MKNQSAFQFFRQRAGYATPPGKLACAKALALAESMGEELGLTVVWEYEEEDWMTFAGDPESEYREKFQSGEWECFHAYILGDNFETLASLGGIILDHKDRNDTMRVYNAELMQEALETIKRGDK